MPIVIGVAYCGDIGLHFNWQTKLQTAFIKNAEFRTGITYLALNPSDEIEDAFVHDGMLAVCGGVG